MEFALPLDSPFPAKKQLFPVYDASVTLAHAQFEHEEQCLESGQFGRLFGVLRAKRITNCTKRNRLHQCTQVSAKAQVI